MHSAICSKDVQNFLIQNKSAILSFFKSQEKEYPEKPDENINRSKFKLTTQPGRVVGVFGLSQYTDESDLLRIFQEFGKIEKSRRHLLTAMSRHCLTAKDCVQEIHIIRDRYNQRSRGFGFVYLRTKEEAENAIRSLSNSIIDGHKVRIDFSNTI